MAGMNLSLCVTANNDEKTISDCLSGLKGIAEEVIVADIGSADHTAELAGKVGAEVCRLDGSVSYAEAKNECIGKATGRWLLFLDGDETISSDSVQWIEPLLENPNAEGYLLFPKKNPEGRSIYSPVQSLRLLRNRKYYRFRYQSFERIPDELITGIQSAPVLIRRCGQTHLASRASRLSEDISHYPDDSYIPYICGIELLNRQKWKESIPYFQAAYDRVNFDFLFAPHLFKCLSWVLLFLEQYEEAQNILDEGVLCFPGYTDLLVLRAELFRRARKEKEAVRDLENCLQIREQPNNLPLAPEIDSSVVLEALGEVHESLDDKEKAIACYEKAYDLSKDPEFLQKTQKMKEEML